MSKVCIFLADGFEEIEGLMVVNLLRRANIDTSMVSIMKKEYITGSHQIEVKADKLYEEMDFSQTEVLILPGGMPGTKHLGEHKELVNLLKAFNEKGKLIGAICAAPSVLGENGILNNKKATCYPGFEDKLEKAILTKDKLVKDQNIITAKGMGVSIEFALAIVEEIKGKEIAGQIADSIQFT